MIDNSYFISDLRPLPIQSLNFIFGRNDIGNRFFRLVYEVQYDIWDLYIRSKNNSYWIYLEEFSVPYHSIEWLKINYDDIYNKN